MCGLTGFVMLGSSSDELVPIVRRMCDALVHRGPDDAGEWIDADRGVAIGFRRLAIIDLSPAGHQPMLSASGRFVGTLNGEIYNFEELRSELQATGLAPSFRGHSDTEVMLAAFDAWGVEAAVKRAFRQLVAIVPRRGRIIANGDDTNVREVVAGAPCPVEFFSMTGYRLPLPGQHNQRNAAAVAMCAEKLGLKRGQIR